MALTIYHNPRCSKSRETLSLLEGRGLVPRVIEYLKVTPSAAELKRILKALDVSAKEIVRKKEAAEAKIDVETLAEADLISAMVAHPEIIERPIVVNGEKAAIGRPPARVLDIL
jgi:arsenate reductase